MTSFVAWVVLPLTLLGVAYGLGALAALLARVSPPPALLAPLGAGAAVAIALTGYVIGLRGVLAPLLLVVLAAAGWALAVLRPRALPVPGFGAAVWSLTYALYLAPVALTGHWTWLGYNFVNDTSVQLLLVDWLSDHGRNPAAAVAVSTPLDVITSYINTGYPLGSHALLAAIDAGVPVRAEVLYQPFIAVFGGLGAVALAVLARRVVGVPWAAVAGVGAMASNLLYQYALQGNMKEIVTAAMIATVAGAAAWSAGALAGAELAERGRILTGAAVLVALPTAAAIDVLSTAGGPYVALVIVLWAAVLLAKRLVPGPRAFVKAVAAGGAVLLALTLVQLSTLITFGEATSTTYAAPERASELGHLAGPLRVGQAAGIWLNADYRFAPEGLNLFLTTAGIWIALALAVAAVVWAVRRRAWEVLLFSVPVVAIMLIVTPRVSPYADAKTYMLMAPGVTLLAVLGAAALASLFRPLGIAAAAVLLAGVAGSDALAYHGVQLAPTDRMAALRDLDDRLAGQGPILFNEPEEFAKTFMGDTRVNVGAEAITPSHTALRVPQRFAYLWFDLDDLVLDWVEQFPVIVFRRSPAASRPPANYEKVYSNEYYDVWRRLDGPEVLEHLPLQLINQGANRPACKDVRAMARRLEPGQRLVAARMPATVRLDTVTANRTPSWIESAVRPGSVVTQTPGEAKATVELSEGGRYRAWIGGSFGRRVHAFVDGEEVGSAVGVNTVGQWHELGTVELPAGRHELMLRRGSGTLRPGDGYRGDLGPLALQRDEETRLEEFTAATAGRLCDAEWDWIERVDGA